MAASLKRRPSCSGAWRKPSPRPSRPGAPATKSAEQIEDEFYRLMASGAFLPNSPTLMNAGRRLGMLSACFVLPLEDSIEDIMATARQIALVQRAGGGTGIDLSRLRPKGSIVRSSGGTTDGPLSFLKMLSGVTEAIQQGAFRRGANMGVMRVDHPDILAFIDVKSDLAQLSNYNLSVAMTDAFMESLKSARTRPHVVVNPHTGQRGVLSKRNDSAEYDHAASADGDELPLHGSRSLGADRPAGLAVGRPGPGLHRRGQPAQPDARLGPIRATNPCGEQPLLPYEACNLGSINLAAFCDSRPADSAVERIDWERLRQTVELAVRFLDNVVEVNKYPTPEIDEATRATQEDRPGRDGFCRPALQARRRLRLRRGSVTGRTDRLVHPRSRLGRKRAAGRSAWHVSRPGKAASGTRSTAAGRCGTPTS